MNTMPKLCKNPIPSMKRSGERSPNAKDIYLCYNGPTIPPPFTLSNSCAIFKFFGEKKQGDYSSINQSSVKSCNILILTIITNKPIVTTTRNPKPNQPQTTQSENFPGGLSCRIRGAQCAYFKVFATTACAGLPRS